MLRWASMKEETQKVLKRLERMGERKLLPSIGPIKGKMIADVVEDYKPKKILEIGTLYGYSAILMRSLLPDENGKVLTVEIDKEYANIARKNVEDAALASKVNVVVGDALEVIPKLHQEFDMVFLDAKRITLSISDL